MKKAQILSAAGLLCLALLTGYPAQATDRFDLAVALKTLPLLTNKMTNPAKVAIVYDSASPESKADAESIQSIIDGGLEAPGNIKLVASMVDVAELTKLNGKQIAFLADGIPSADDRRIGNGASAAGVLTICTNIDCVKTDDCILGVVSKPRVEVYYSPAAAGRARISFVSAFTMLAKQVGSM
ncbi:MAG: hypothetical protein KGI97_01370 [Alphaproteobacteria bacterium]|nr:hypothetical protein [Alphaproteobacteria bacterium]